MHPADELSGSTSSIFAKKRIVLAVTGSIAAVDSIRLARELIRNGAKVIPVMTPAATKIIHPDALEFATGKKPITLLTGQIEHVQYCGQVKNPVDLLLIAPCTANTISKIAHGIDDTTVTTFATTALGSNIPIIIVPAMHLSMYDHIAVQKNKKICKNMGITFVEPKITEHKAKLATTEEIVAKIQQVLSPNDLLNKKILIIGGATAEPIDDIRVLTNKSSGKTAIALVKNAYQRGADVDLWYGQSSEPIPSYITIKRFSSIQDLQNLVKNQNIKTYDTIILCAAVSDYQPKKYTGKIPSGKTNFAIDLTPTPKIIKDIREKAPNSQLIGFKVETNKKDLEKKSQHLLHTQNLEMVIGNTLSAFGSDENEILLLFKNGKKTQKKGKKQELAQYILNQVI